MKQDISISTNRIEAFSDGIIAILITIMVFDLKIDKSLTSENVWRELLVLLPKFISYVISFIMLAIMWVSHHQLFHSLQRSSKALLWHNIHLLFWMSIIPFSTNFIGSHPFLWQASFLYGSVFFMCALSFTLLRTYSIKAQLFHQTVTDINHKRITSKNKIALLCYALAAGCSLFSVFISFTLFIVVPALYCLPEKHDN